MSCEWFGFKPGPLRSIFELLDAGSRVVSSAPSSAKANQSQTAKRTLLVCFLCNLAAMQEKESVTPSRFSVAHVAVKVRARHSERRKAP